MTARDAPPTHLCVRQQCFVASADRRLPFLAYVTLGSDESEQPRVVTCEFHAPWRNRFLIESELFSLLDALSGLFGILREHDVIRRRRHDCTANVQRDDVTRIPVR